MFQQASFNLEIGSDEIRDLDLTPSGDWIAVTASQQLVFRGNHIPFTEELWYPKVRAIGDDLAVILSTRADNEPNAWIINSSGQVIRSFFAGDAIQDVLTSDRYIVISYFDESACTSTGIEGNGVAVFDTEGNYEFGYRELFEAQAVDISDCYCTCWADENRMLFYPYMGFPVVSFDLLNKTQTVYDGPSETAGSGAISSIGDITYFHSPYDDENGVYRWKVGDRGADKVWNHSARLRGLKDGHFLAVGKSGYTIVSPDTV